jgi:haloalkane dehalogenase
MIKELYQIVKRSSNPFTTDASSATATISGAFSYAPHFVEVRGSRTHYIEQGPGDSVLFLHGNPTWSYLWRNVIPHVSMVGRCIAPDLIGMGRSDKPPLDYRLIDHIRYLEGFIEALQLRRITLVIHDWGSALGFDYACRHEDNVRAIAFMEAITRPSTWREQTLTTRWIFRRMRHPVKGRRMIIDNNFFIERMLPKLTSRKLTREEMDHYRAPYVGDPETRKPLLVWPAQIPFDGEPADTYERITSYAAWLRASTLPKLLLWAKPGLILPPREVARLHRELRNLDDVYLGKGRHFLPEEYPHEIGGLITNWYWKLPGLKEETPPKG